MEIIYGFLIDPFAEDAILIQYLLRQQNYFKLDLIRVPDLNAGKAELQDKLCDLLILHLDSADDKKNLEDLSEVVALYPHIPILVISDITDPDFCYQVFLRGAQDYLVKGSLTEQNIFMAIINAINRKKKERELLYIANHDPLTGLPNRRLFSDRLERGMKRFYRKTDQLSLGILMLDLDGFKEVNDCFGHQIGDKVLAEIGSRLNSRLRKNDTVARLGGDEFVIILEGIVVDEIAKRVAEELVEIVNQPIKINDHQIMVAGSIGISIYPKHGKEVEKLLEKADRAMYKAKNSKGKVHVYDG